MKEVGVKKESLGGEANDKKQGKNREHAKINAKNDAQFPTRVDFLGLFTTATMAQFWQVSA